MLTLAKKNKNEIHAWIYRWRRITNTECYSEPYQYSVKAEWNGLKRKEIKQWNKIVILLFGYIIVYVSFVSDTKY